MRGRLIPLMMLVAVCATCVPSEQQDDTSASHLRFSIAGVGDAGVPVRGSYCAQDSTLAIAGASDSWSAALAFRTTWPLGGPRTDTLMPRLGDAGAAFAVRPLDDSVGVAYIAQRGTATLTGTRALSGTVTGILGGDSTGPRITASFDGVAVDAACP